MTIIKCDYYNLALAPLRGKICVLLHNAFATAHNLHRTENCSRKLYFIVTGNANVFRTPHFTRILHHLAQQYMV